ncbi:hypothetical protein PINS_up008639 [Pythium insidiosum]|nr:hypothetical protein PINS_up008639 [Pythium insidiosum]
MTSHTPEDSGFEFHLSDRWARYYPGMEVAVVTSIEKPPTPPEGYVPLRLGVHHQFDEPLTPEECEDMTGFSLDTLLWDTPLLEARLHELTTWMRRSPLSLREKLDRINWLINSK